MKPVIGHTVPLQVAFVGPLGVGKTTAVRSLSLTPVVSTDVARSALAKDATHVEKRTTTVGIDYGEWVAPDGRRVSILGTPGQARFESARAAALAARTQIVLWLFGDHPRALEECHDWLTYLGEEVWPRLTVGITRMGPPGTAPQLWDYRRVLDAVRPGIPLAAGDPRDRVSVAELVLLALLRFDEQTRARRSGPLPPGPAAAWTQPLLHPQGD